MEFRPFRIENIKIAPGLVLAPMSGITNSAFRRLIREENPNALGLVVTEFISIEGLTRENRRTLDMLRFKEEERPISIQIFGHEISRLVDAAKMVQDAGADIIDINSGCPVPKVVRRGGGCELMRQPEHLEKMLRAVRQAVSIPLTLKIRAGWDENSKNAVEVGRMAEQAGVSMLAVHGRTRAELYRGSADWNIVDSVAQELSIPVVGSGDVYDYQSAKERYRGKVSGLMIGRGALQNPWIFSELMAGEASHLAVKRSGNKHEIIRVLRRYMELLLEIQPEKGVVGSMKQFISQVTRSVRGSADVRRSLCMSRSLEEMRGVLKSWESDSEELDSCELGAEQFGRESWSEESARV